MKKLLFGFIFAFVSLALISGGVLAAPGASSPAFANPYDGKFFGFVYGDQSSKAPILLELKQDADVITGKVHVEEGLFVDGGVCGAVNVPATVQSASGKIVSGQPNRLQTGLAFTVSDFQIKANLDGELSQDGSKLTAKAKIDLPWLCGRDPILTAELTRLPEG